MVKDARDILESNDLLDYLKFQLNIPYHVFESLASKFAPNTGLVPRTREFELYDLDKNNITASDIHRETARFFGMRNMPFHLKTNESTETTYARLDQPLDIEVRVLCHEKRAALALSIY